MLRFHFETVDSTSTRAAQLAALNPGQNILVSARAQTAGRGRDGRPWQSPAGGAWFSLALPTACAPAAGADPDAYEALPLVAGYAVLRALRHLLAGSTAGMAATLEIKWPNDVLLEGGKAAGVLCERVLPALGPSAAAPADSPPLLLVGVGVNVNNDPAALGTPLRYPAASLHAVAGTPLDIDRVVECCAARVLSAKVGLERHGLTAELVAVLEAHLAWKRQRLVFEHAGQRLEGRCLGLDERGRLRVQIDGAVRVFSIGEIRHAMAADDLQPADAARSA
jgi:BirA family biotin operon repressor/biotin-[acetyl-CoA-carboxylase] ligase